MNLRHMFALARKEFYHIVRDPGTFLLVTVGPVFLMIVFTYMLTSEVKNAPVGVIDHAHNDASAELIDRIEADPVTRIAAYYESVDATDLDFQRGDIVAAVEIPENYGQFSLLGDVPTVHMIVDGMEPTSAEQVLETVYTIADEHTRDLAGDALSGFGLDSSLLDLPINVETETLFNPDLRSIVDFYPGLMGMMLTLPALALALSLAKEAENGTLEQLVASPVDKRALLAGKMLPYLVFGMIDVVILFIMGQVAYSVPFRGSLPEYLLVALLFNMANLGLALLIAVFVRSQQVAIIVAFLVFFVPPFFLSGMFFPADAMPFIVQLEMVEFPSMHYVSLAKAIFLQGTSIRDLLFNFVILAILGIELFEIAAFIFRKKIIVTVPWRKWLNRNEKRQSLTQQTIAQSRG
ncbi:MAG: ABC transporter permease [Anaerolineae bacterium]|nr:ABC transporter permease [Anaerolineae bacterium]